MKVIYKYEVQISEHFIIDMPSDSKILSVQVDQKTGKPCLWALIEKDQKDHESRVLSVFGTGNPIEDHENIELDFIGTFQLHNGQFVGHLFELYV